MISSAVLPGSSLASEPEPQATRAKAASEAEEDGERGCDHAAHGASLDNMPATVICLHMRLTGRPGGGRRGVSAGRPRRSPRRPRSMSYGDPVEARRAGLGVELEPGGPGVAVARLADAARVDEPAAVAELERSSRRPPGRPARVLRPAALGPGEEERDVGVADQRRSARAARRGRARPARSRARTPRPGRAARRGRGRSRGARRQDPARAGTRGCRSAMLSWVQRDRVGRGLGEGRDVERAEHREVVVADQADRAALAHQGGAGVGLGAVADHVAEAPDLLGAGRRRSPRGRPRGRADWSGCR